jgi:hypothetical protein
VDEAGVIRYVTTAFDQIHVHTSEDGTSFFFYEPDRMFPFATLVTSDAHDTASDLNRPGVFRLNIGVGRKTFKSLFPSPESEAGDDFDFTALDLPMPHPVYRRNLWVCVLSPSDTTFETLKPLLAEAYDLAASKHAKREAAQRRLGNREQ